MKKSTMLMSAAALGMLGLGAYIFINKKTKKKADKLINNVLDKADSYTKNMTN